MLLNSRALSLVVSAAALLVLASCGSSDSESADTAEHATRRPSRPQGLLDDRRTVWMWTTSSTARSPRRSPPRTAPSAVARRPPATASPSPATRPTMTPGRSAPSTITDGADAGGIWFDGEEVYDLDGQFIEDLATTYGDDNWRMYDDEGNVLVTETAEEFEAAARPDVDPALQNHCVEGRLEWLENGEPITTTVLIPVTPVAADEQRSARRATRASRSTASSSRRRLRWMRSSAPTRSRPSTTAAATTTPSTATTCTARSAARRSARPPRVTRRSSATRWTATRCTARSRPARSRRTWTSATATPPRPTATTTTPTAPRRTRSCSA